MNAEPTALLWLVALLLVGGGFLIGLALGRSSSKLEARCRELEGALEESKTAHAKYRDEVGGHFGKTSELLRDLTLQYRAVYEHLAEGAQTLCPDLATGLPAGGVAGLLAEAAEAEAAARATVVADTPGDPTAPTDSTPTARTEAETSTTATGADPTSETVASTNAASPAPTRPSLH